MNCRTVRHRWYSLCTASTSPTTCLFTITSHCACLCFCIFYDHSAARARSCCRRVSALDKTVHMLGLYHIVALKWDFW